MAQKAIQGSMELAKKIRQRRQELGLTIEDAASHAGVGTKTWCRYEAGESIRNDKLKGICKALNWLTLPGEHNADDELLSVAEYKTHEAWSTFLEYNFGIRAAMAFAIGSDILNDHIREDMEELASLPRGSHVGQLDISQLQGILPKQFLMCYDFDFLYRMRCLLNIMRSNAHRGNPMFPLTVMEEVIFQLCCTEASVLMELGIDEEDEVLPSSEWTYEEWKYAFFDEMDILSVDEYLYSDIYLTSDHPYHFSHWFDQQFHTSNGK